MTERQKLEQRLNNNYLIVGGGAWQRRIQYVIE